jgi:hypothetical protein
LARRKARGVTFHAQGPLQIGPTSGLAIQAMRFVGAPSPLEKRVMRKEE